MNTTFASNSTITMIATILCVSCSTCMHSGITPHQGGSYRVHWSDNAYTENSINKLILEAKEKEQCIQKDVEYFCKNTIKK